MYREIFRTTMFFLPDDFWNVKKTKEKGLGVFAQKQIPKGTILGDYLGRVIKTADYDMSLDKTGLYLLYYSDVVSVYPDLEKPGMYLLNHSCSPNCFMYIYRGHTLFFTLRTIKPREELTVHYLLSPKTESCNPCLHVCKCHKKNCVGTMHLSKEKYALWRQFQNEETKNMKKAKAVVGKIFSYSPHIQTSFLRTQSIHSYAPRGKAFKTPTVDFTI